MAEYKPDEESILRAERISSRLMDDLREVTEIGPQREMRRELFSEQRYSIQADRDRKLEAAREHRKNRRQRAA